jgi:hypothetical protein
MQNSRTADWRRFGGGGLVLAGGILLIGELARAVWTPLGDWLVACGVVVVAIALLAACFGQTGSNGIVGASFPGKAALVAAAVGWLLVAVILVFQGLAMPVPRTLVVIAIVLATGAGLMGSIVVQRHGVARGPARYALYPPSLWGGIAIAGVLAWVPVPSALGFGTLGILLVIAGMLYARNGRSLARR